VNAISGRDTFVNLLRNTYGSFELPGSTEECIPANDEVEVCFISAAPGFHREVKSKLNLNEDTTNMNTAKKTTGAAIAIAAATLLATAPMSASAGSQVGKCMGANSCKGHSACKTATSSCKGLNACKGQGFLEMTKAQCDEAEGNFET